jgi:hypothetical protein
MIDRTPFRGQGVNKQRREEDEETERLRDKGT